MSKRIPGVIAALVLFTVATAGDVGAKSPATHGGKAVFIPADEIKWIPMKDVPDVKMATVWGNSEKGEHGSMMKFPAGFAAPLHFHSSNHHVFVISGTMELTPEGGEAKKLGPGSYFAFTGKKKHTTKCLEGSECVIAMDCAGPWDVVMADKAAAAAPKK